MCFLVFFMTWYVIREIPRKVADRPHFGPIQESHTM